MPGHLTATLVVATRDLKKWVGRRPVLVVSLATPIIWIALFGKSFNPTALFGGSPPPGVPQQIVEAVRRMFEQRLLQLFGTTDYFTYFASGMLVVFMVFQGMFSGISVIFDKRLGYLDRMLVAPIPRISIFAGKVLATLVRVTILGTILLAASLALGMRLKEGITPLDLLAAWAASLALAATIASAYTALSFYAENQEVVFAVGNLVNLPLMFTSNAIFPLEQMPDWLKTLAKANPVTYAADIVRYHLIGRPIDNYGFEAAVLALLALATIAVSAWLSVRWMNSR